MRSNKFISLILFFVVSGGFLVAGNPFPRNEVEALLEFKEAIDEDPFDILSDWNDLDEEPCDWPGVSCSFAMDRVVKINISGLSLRGFLAPELAQIIYLQELILHENNLIGIIPEELGSLEFLKVLDLGMNQLTGPIPSELGNLTSIQKMNLQSNGLSGTLPHELGNLKSLEEIRLDRNKLSGILPATNNSATTSYKSTSSANLTGLCQTSQLKVADFSYNFFIGSIPKCLSYLPSTSFQGNCFHNKDTKQRNATQCEIYGAAPPENTHQKPKARIEPTDDISKHRGSSRPLWLLALKIVTGTLVGLLLLIALLATIHRCKSKASLIIPWKKSASEKDHTAVYIDSELLRDVTRFSRQELEVACEDFSNIIGASPNSLVYKGTMKGGSEIAVISLCVKEEDWTGYLELYFQKEVADLARISHENTGKLLGYCKENSHFTRMLVFEYASNGTLYEHLHYGEGSQFSWTRRMKIILGIARGLTYLHSELDPPFSISELNSNAVYLTDDFSPKLVDFESWKTILARSERNSGSIGNQGAICVLPNSMEERYLDIQGNVYGFGVLLLEIISGRPPYCKEKGFLVEWAKEYLEVEELMSNVVDPELKNFRVNELKLVCEVVNSCINPDPKMRPSLDEISRRLEDGIDTSISVELQASNLAWAELALSS